MKVLILAAAALIAPAAAAQTPEAAPAGSAATQAEDPNEMICRSEDVPGSRRRQRVCHTRAEWTALRTEYRERNRNTAEPAQQRMQAPSPY